MSLAVCCLLTALLAGCGGDASSVSSIAETSAPPALTPAEQARADARAAHQRQLELERTFAPNPWREPAASPPHPHGTVKHLIVHEIKRGSGPALRGDE